MTQDDETTIATLKAAMRRFAVARDWDRFHSPKNLVMALACEVAELMEHFLWISEDESRQRVLDPVHREAIADELADVAGLVLQFSIHSDIDLTSAIREKLVKNEHKYPAPSPTESGE